jgi:hypothetical protein
MDCSEEVKDGRCGRFIFLEAMLAVGKYFMSAEEGLESFEHYFFDNF